MPTTTEDPYPTRLPEGISTWVILCECPMCLDITTWSVPALWPEVSPQFVHPHCRKPAHPQRDVPLLTFLKIVLHG